MHEAGQTPSNGATERTALLDGASDISAFVKGVDQDIEDHPPVGWRPEVKALCRMTIPLWVTFCLEYAIGGFSVAFVGHLGVKSLNAASIGNLTMSTTTVAPLIYGLCAALDTLATQAYTSSNPKNTSLYVMRTAVIMYASLIPASVLLWFGESILLALKQDAEVARLAGQYIRVYLAGIPLLGGYELIRRWLQVQGLILIPTVVLFIAAPLCLTLNYLLVLGPESVSMGFIGSAVAVVITNAVMFVTLAIYAIFFTPRDAWGGVSSAIFYDLGPNIRLGLAGIAATCSEWLSWDIVSIMSSLIGPEPFAANQILIVFAVTTYQLPFAMSVAASIRIGNLVGARQIHQAKLATEVTRWATIAVGLLNSVVAIVSRDHISRIFTEDRSVSRLVSLVMPLVALFQILDAISGTCSGILRGAGLAGIAARANIIAYWFFGIPTGVLLAFHFGWGLQGLWTGHVVALSLTTILTGIPTYTIRWHERAEAAQLQAEETEAYLQAHRIDHEEE